MPKWFLLVGPPMLKATVDKLVGLVGLVELVLLRWKLRRTTSLVDGVS